MSSAPTKRKPINKYTRTVGFAVITTPKKDLIWLLKVMPFRFNLMKQNPIESHGITLKKWGFNRREIDQLGIKLK